MLSAIGWVRIGITAYSVTTILLRKENNEVYLYCIKKKKITRSREPNYF
jgi:hypothetical protein